ncbi:hypothetical protein UPYG_G00015500 [Umbra pygmaea]|uniref:Uncharacterized protein n=1 Tax=Umbra pygmaea TaxID=75934 RepID=A0ABD0XJJ4_UMBPY
MQFHLDLGGGQSISTQQNDEDNAVDPNELAESLRRINGLKNNDAPIRGSLGHIYDSSDRQCGRRRRGGPRDLP